MAQPLNSAGGGAKPAQPSGAGGAAANRHLQTVERCRRRLRQFGAQLDIRLELARALMALHRGPEAERELLVCVRQDPNCVEAYRLLGEIAYRLNQRERALRFLEKAAALEPDDPSNWLALDILRNAQADAEMDASETVVRAPQPGPPAKPEPHLFSVPPPRVASKPGEVAIVVEEVLARRPPVARPPRAPEEAGPDTIPDLDEAMSRSSQPLRPLALTPLFSQRPGARLRWLVVGGLVAAGAGILGVSGLASLSHRSAPGAGDTVAAAAGPLAGALPEPTQSQSQRAVPPAAAPGGATGAAAAGIDPRWTEVLAADTWLHPLGGPVRRMPVRDARVFGAERPGERPGECRNGHCGVDLGETWGEPVLAAHAGVVDRVQRGPNPDHGGLYVRIAHRSGTVFTQYFHLAAIPHRVQPGVAIKAGEVIGLVGDSGVRTSGPHLHFTISVRVSRQGLEQYIDPEPLIALWPLRVPDGPGSGLLDASAAPGLLRGPAVRRKHKRPHAPARAPTEQPAAPAGDPSGD